MNFNVAEELGSVQQLTQQILGDFTAPEQLRQLETETALTDTPLWRALAEAGLLGLDIAEDQGGTDMGFYAQTTLCEEVGRSAALLPVIPALVSAAGTLRRFGSDAQKERWLPGIASGSSLLGAALEDYQGDDPASGVAERVEGGFAISGHWACVSVAAQAQRLMLCARCDDEPVVVWVDPGAAGVTLSPQLVTSGETRFDVHLQQLQVPIEDVLATGARALAAMTWACQATRTALCAMALGACDKMMRLTGQYTSEREQFGRAIATFQAVSHRVADCYIDVESLRLVTQQAASLLEQGRPADEASTIAKIWCGDVCHRVSQAAQHCHGGTGVDRDYPLHRYCLLVRQIELSMGSSARLTGKLGEDISRHFLAAANA